MHGRPGRADVGAAGPAQPKLPYTQDNLPDREMLRHRLREASEHYDPVDVRLAIERELIDLERRHGVRSAEFYARLPAGEGGDLPDEFEELLCQKYTRRR